MELEMNKMAQHYDVTIVGAGPAGSTCAQKLAKAGLRVALIDRRTKLGNPVQCGEFLPTSHEMLDMLPSCKRASRLVNVPSQFIENKTHILRMVSPKNSEFQFSLRANILNRADFDSSLAMTAIDLGADLLLGSRVIRVDNESRLVLKNNGETMEITSYVVVAADGATSVVAKYLGHIFTHDPNDISPAIQFVLEGCEFDDDVTEMYFGSDISPGGYAWIIPKSDNVANVGLGIRRQFQRDNAPLIKYLQRMIKKHPLVAPRCKKAKIKARVSALIPMGGPLKKTYSKSTLLVGDAAGHVMASNGGGIPTALAGGDIAADTIISYLSEGTPLSEYEKQWRVEFGNELDSALRILHIADRVMPSESLTDICMRLAGPRFLKHIIRCRLPIAVDLASKTFVSILRYFL